LTRTVLGKARQNGVAERMNRTLNERARSMHIHAGLPKKLWANIVNTTTYLINRGSSIPFGDKVPEEVWLGKKVDLPFLRTFGCVAYVMIDPEKRDKLDTKSKKCYFLVVVLIYFAIGCGMVRRCLDIVISYLMNLFYTKIC